jgi:uroporphyrin-III C-methyltransferase / precorrin-2 dehydrogenase / sirohydrochlorin ferrochelatase
MHSLPLFVRLAGRPFILLGDGEAAAAKRRLLERAGARVGGEESVASLAIVAIEDDAAAQAAVTRLKIRGILVNAVDRPALCDFTLPAIVDRDPVLIAIGTGGASAGLAKALRQRLEGMVPQTLGDLAKAMKGARAAMRTKWPDGAARRHAIDAALEPGGALDPLRGDSVDNVASWLTTASTGPETALHHLRITSDDADDLTLRQARLLAQADTVYHQSNVAPSILNRARADAARFACDVKPVTPPDGVTLYLERI